eukprot:TRINITY_DN2704_c0_g2_i1.p1 TRINITY_DN2704_c0_g2~~TRINITY_DN2704_c0_g2_i1.p1  ORF type:complete len:531 (+),score=118.42 TRINITY_DN2704_c0_g2_i1:232-1593(+)
MWPLPEVWGHTPEQCEWKDSDWLIVRHDKADENGWSFGSTFTGKLTAVQSATDCIRTRLWRRTAKVKSEHSTEKSKAKEQHASKCSAMARIKKHEAVREEAYHKEVAAGTSIKSIVVGHYKELDSNSKVLQALAESITQISEHQQNLSKCLKKIHGMDLPPTANTNPIVALHASLNTFTCNAATHLHDMNNLSSNDTLKSLQALVNVVETQCTAIQASEKKILKKLDKAGDEVKACYGKYIKSFEQSTVHFGEDRDLWLVEKEYCALDEKFSKLFKEYIETLIDHLKELQDLEVQVVDMVTTAGHSLTRMLKGFGGGSAWVGEDPVTRDITKIPERVSIPVIDLLASPLVLKHGSLQTKSMVGWKSNYAIATADRWLYLAQVPQEGKPLNIAVSLSLSNCDISPCPENPETFLLHGVTAGFLGQSEKHIRFKATSEEEMVDWMVVLKQRKEQR